MVLNKSNLSRNLIETRHCCSNESYGRGKLYKCMTRFGRFLPIRTQLLVGRGGGSWCWCCLGMEEKDCLEGEAFPCKWEFCNMILERKLGLKERCSLEETRTQP